MNDTSLTASDVGSTELLRAIAERQDRGAFTLIFNEYGPKLKTFLKRGGLEGAVAEELVQEIMLTVWRRASTFDPAQGGVATWIYTIARNRRIDHFRRMQRPVPEDARTVHVDNLEVATDGLVEQKESYISLKTAINSLPPEQIEVLRLAFFEQKPHRAIALERDLPLGTVKSRIRRALHQLRKELEPLQ